jgi:hypothetical protein
VQLQRIVIREKERVRKVRAKRRKVAGRPATKAKTKPKPPLPQIFGEGIHDPLVKITPEVKDRINQAGLRVTREVIDGKGPTDRDETGNEYYQLIAEMEHMTSHDIYTLFVSGNPFQS